jgi:hypothetical protein
MWYRDYEIARQRVEERERDARTHAAISAFTAATRTSRRGPRQQLARVTAIGARWFGRQALALACRLDDGTCERSVYGSPREVVYR